METSPYAKLAAIDVKDRIEKKNGLSYLSWAWAVDQLMRADQSANWTYGEPKQFGQTVMVYCSVTALGKTMTAHLPVMDNKNKAISNPDAFAMNTAMMRCLVKAIALHGLGLYIYAGEDLPPDESGELAATEKKQPSDQGRSLPPIRQDIFDKMVGDLQAAPNQAAIDATKTKIDDWIAKSKDTAAPSTAQLNGLKTIYETRRGSFIVDDEIPF